MSKKLEAIKSLREECLSCSRCGLCQNRAEVKSQLYNPQVFGNGDISSKIMLVGQNPGRNETVAKKPFIGASGIKLDVALEQCGLKRKDVYVTNAVKCFTVGNTVPPDDSVQACRYYLKREIEIVEPEVVIIMGSSALRSFDNSVKYSMDLCKSKKLIETELFNKTLVTCHPAFTIYNPEARAILSDSILEACRLSHLAGFD